MTTNAKTVDLHIYARLAKFGDIEHHTRIEISRKITRALGDLGIAHEFITTIPRIEIIERDE